MLVFDNNRFGTKRELDPNGFLKVSACNITKTQIRAYYGREIPGWRELDLDADTIYNVYCPAEELQKALESFNNLPLTREHIEVDVENVPKDKIVGSLGDHAEYKKPYVKNSLIVYDKKDIDWILSGKKKELSCGYRYTPVRQSGEFDGKHYDFIMTDIIGNHVALVKEGRAGHDVMVADESPEEMACDYNGYHDDEGKFCCASEASVSSKISFIINKAKETGTFDDNAIIGNVSDYLIEEGAKVGLDLTGYEHAIDVSAVKHIMDRHGSQEKEDNRGQMAITDDDFLLIPQILENPDEIEFTGKNKKGLETIRYKKSFDDGTVYYFEEKRSPKREHKLLSADTMYKKRSGQVTEDSKESTVLQRPKPLPDSDIIAQESKNVNSKFCNGYFDPNFTENQIDNTILHEGEEIMLANDEFKEADHPRDKDGKFTTAGGSSSGSSLKDDKDVENYWQGSGSKESQSTGVVKVMKKQLEDLKAEHKKIFGKPMFVSKEEQERGEIIGKQIKDLEDEIDKKESDGSGVNEEKAKQYKEWWDGLSEQDKKDAIMGVASKDPKIKELMGEKLFKDLSEGKKESKGSEKKEERVTYEKFKAPLASKIGNWYGPQGEESADKAREMKEMEWTLHKLNTETNEEEKEELKRDLDWEMKKFEEHFGEKPEKYGFKYEKESSEKKEEPKKEESNVSPEVKNHLEKKINGWYENVRQDYVGIDGKFLGVSAEGNNLKIKWEENGKKKTSTISWYKEYTPEQLYDIWMEFGDEGQEAVDDSKKEMAKDKEIPEKAGKPEKAGDEVALNQGETKMAEEVKEAPAEKKVEETKKEEVVEDACKKAEDKKEVKPACDEKEDKRKLIDEIGGILKGKLDDELLRTVLAKAEKLAYNDSERSADDEKKDDLKGKEQKAFAEGVDFGEKKEKAEPKKLDSEHESEGMKKAEKKEMAKDSALAMDVDAIKAQVREEVMADFKAREEARKAVRGFVGDVNVMAFDSAEDIYKFACGKSGMDLDEIVSFKDAFKGLSAGKSKLALDASPVSGSNEECLKDIRIAN